MKQKKYLKLYKEWSKTGKLPEYGLCNSLVYPTRLRLFEPTKEDDIILRRTGYSNAYWGSGLLWNDRDKYQSFTPLRQNIVLFLAAMNGEI